MLQQDKNKISTANRGGGIRVYAPKTKELRTFFRRSNGAVRVSFDRLSEGDKAVYIRLDTDAGAEIVVSQSETDPLEVDKLVQRALQYYETDFVGVEVLGNEVSSAI